MNVRHAAVAACLVAGTIVPAAHAADSPVLVLRAAHSGWVDVAVPKGFTVDDPRPDVRLRGRYVGYFAERTGVADAPGPHTGRAFGSLAVAMGHNVWSRDYVESPGVTAGGTTPLLSYGAGTYRFHVLTDRPVVLRIPVRGLDDDVAATVRTRSRVAFATAASSASTGGTVELNVPVPVAAGRVLFVTGGGGASPPQRSEGYACVLDPGGTCTTEPSQAEYAHAWKASGFVVVPPAAVAAGTYRAYERLAAAGDLTVSVFALAVDAPAA